MIEDSMFTSTFWTRECSAGGKRIATEGIGYRFEHESDGNPPGDGSGTRRFNFAFQAAPYIIDNRDIYSEELDAEGRRFAVVEFCIRTALVTPGEFPVEVNFIESLWLIRYVFEHGIIVIEDVEVRKPEGKLLILFQKKCQLLLCQSAHDRR